MDKLAKDKQPVLVTRDEKAVAALVPISIFKQRFVDYLTEDALHQAIEELKQLESISRKPDSLVELRRLRAS